jgi:very-short-patch-repair endonuclease
MTRAERNLRFKEAPDSAIRRLAARQHSLISWRQAVDAGFTPAAISRRVAAGFWERMLPRVYRIAGSPSTERRNALAACMWAGDDAVVSHRTAGVLWNLDGVTTRAVEVTVPADRAPTSSLVTVHRTKHLPRADRVMLGVIPITSPTRTLMDLAGCADEEGLETAVECALRRGLVRESVLRRRVGGKGRGGTSALRSVLDARDPGSAPLESRLEVKVWRLIVRSGLPKPVRQHRVDIGGRRYRLDFAWPTFGVAVEADGFATHGGRRAFHFDRRRTATLSADWRIIPVTWVDVTARADAWLTDLGRALVVAA